jgi:hypothetical protein
MIIKQCLNDIEMTKKMLKNNTEMMLKLCQNDTKMIPKWHKKVKRHWNDV